MHQEHAHGPLHEPDVLLPSQPSRPLGRSGHSCRHPRSTARSGLWIDVGPKLVAGDAVEFLGAQHILGRELPRLIDPAPHGGLGDTKVPSHLAFRAGYFAAGQKSFVSGSLIHKRVAARLWIVRQPAIA